jgi:hypothetical protein
MESQLFGWFLGLQKSFSIVINNKSASMCLTFVPLHIYTMSEIHGVQLQ